MFYNRSKNGTEENRNQKNPIFFLNYMLLEIILVGINLTKCVCLSHVGVYI